jgi:long-chain acyl-CoA synthetase
MRPPILDPDHLTLDGLLRFQAASNPASPALLSPARCLDWAALDQEVDRLSSLLLELGVAEGDAVGLMCAKRPEVVTTFLACARVGALAVPVNFKLLPEQIETFAASVRLRALLAETSLEELTERVATCLPDPRRVLLADAAHHARYTPYETLAAFEGVKVGDRGHPDRICYLNVTSGTTGCPKCARVTHRNIVANGLSGLEGLGFTGADIFFGLFSVFSHPHELFHRSLLVGGPFVIQETMSPRVVCEAVERFKVTWMMAVPSFYAMMLDLGGPGRYHHSPPRVLESGGAWVGAETLAEMESRFHASFMPVWGSTETTGVALAMPPHLPRRPGATGRVAPRYEIRVVDEQGQDLPVGREGEMLVRGQGVVSAYLDAPEETRQAFRDGWYHTADRVRIDDDGFVHFVGRFSDMIKVGGIRVYPLEIEKILAAHPDVLDVVVVRAEDRLRGEIPRAVLRLAADSTGGLDGIRAWVRERLPVYKQPRLLEIWEELPKLPNGKIDRRAVAASPPRGR